MLRWVLFIKYLGLMNLKVLIETSGNNKSNKGTRQTITPPVYQKHGFLFSNI